MSGTGYIIGDIFIKFCRWTSETGYYSTQIHLLRFVSGTLYVVVNLLIAVCVSNSVSKTEY